MEGRRRSSLVLCVALVLLALSTSPVLAHNLGFTETRAVVHPDGRFEIEMVVDLDAHALGAPPSTDSEELAARLEALSAEELRRTAKNLERLFHRRVRVRFDGEPVPFDVAFPERAEGAVLRRGEPTVLGTVAVLTGRVPEDSRELSFFASRTFPPVQWVVVTPLGDEIYRELIQRGARSTPLDLEDLPPPPTGWQVAGRYLVLGFEHILPLGLDHILFVLGLFLLSARPRPLLWQVTAFTAAHTVTLALASLGILSLPSSIVEPLIALSIVYVGVENAVVRELTPWRPAVVFAFGLLHGLGFAGVLEELGLPEGHLAPSLVGFNVGVELGQLAVLALAFGALGVFTQKPWYRRRVAVPLSLLVAAVGLFWVWKRTAP